MTHAWRLILRQFLKKASIDRYTALCYYFLACDPSGRGCSRLIMVSTEQYKTQITLSLHDTQFDFDCNMYIHESMSIDQVLISIPSNSICNSFQLCSENQILILLLSAGSFATELRMSEQTSRIVSNAFLYNQSRKVSQEWYSSLAVWRKAKTLTL